MDPRRESISTSESARDMSGLSLNTSEVSHAFEREQERWLRKRFIKYCTVVIVLTILTRLLIAGIDLATDSALPTNTNSKPTPISVTLSSYGSSIVRASLYGLALFVAFRRPHSRGEILRMVFWLIVLSGTVLLLSNAYSLWMDARATNRSAFDLGESKAFLLGTSGAVAIFFGHFFACLFLPWKPLESLRPVLPLVVLNTVITLFFGYKTPLITILTILTFPIVVLPGIAVSAWRFSRFRDRFAVDQLHGRYREMRRELIDARKLHEALFPAPIATGPVRFSYMYEPMRQIGGDYLFARMMHGPHGPRMFNMLLVDVTGHGIAAALTVNRLYGEIERLFAENPEAGPGEVLASLNRYVHLTLARHSVYVTALCARVNLESDTLEFASGGHPPAFLSTADGRIDQLDSTSFVLGACAAEDFDPCVENRPFHPGDTLIAYTDGAIEARNAGGRMLGIVGLRQILAAEGKTKTSEHGFAPAVLRNVERHRNGPPEDDTLVVELHRPIGVSLNIAASELVHASAR